MRSARWTRAACTAGSEHDDRRAQVLLGLGHVKPAVIVEAEPTGFGRDLVRGHAVEPDADVVGVVALARSDDLAPAVDRRQAAFAGDREQLAGVARAADLDRIRWRRHGVLGV